MLDEPDTAGPGRKETKMENEGGAGAAPVVDTTGGQGGEGEGAASAEGQEGQFGGFNTAEELAADHQTKVTELGELQAQVTNLEGLKGRHGNEIGTLRNQIATLQGHIEGMRTSRPATPAATGPTIDDIAKQLDDGEIDESKAIKLAHQAAAQETETRLGQKFQQMLKSELGEIQRQNAHERYVEKFLADNEGYQEAYESGKLDTWLNQDLTGEQAWDKFQLQTKETELAALKQQAGDAAKAAGEEGFQQGVKIESGKTAAGKVLTGKGGQFSQTTGKYDLSDPAQRRQAGVDLLKQSRGGTA